jgi:DNA-binding NarL/FixJ family response regulator
VLDSPTCPAQSTSGAHLDCPQQVARVLIVDDHPAAREGLAYRLAQEPDFEVCGEASDVAEALRAVAETEPDVIVIDLGLRRGDGLDLVARLKTRGCSAKMLVWSWRSESLYAERALRAGASGYIGKDEATSTVITALHRIPSSTVMSTSALRL